MFSELQISVAAITETWFKGGSQLKEELSDIEQATGIKFICRNRDGRSKQRGGGVAIAFRSACCNFKERRIKNVGSAEILCATGTVGKFKRRVAIFAMYLPPTLPAAQVDGLVELLPNEIGAVKMALDNPIIIVCGDMNGKRVHEAFDIDGDISLVPTGPTRGANTLDLVYSNVQEAVKLSEVVCPLETVQGVPSDHACVMIELEFPQSKDFTWIRKTTRKRSDSADRRFGDEMRDTDWSFLSTTDPDVAVEQFERTLQKITDSYYPLITIRRRSNEDPWITNGIRRRVKRKRRLYRRCGRTRAWKKADDDLQAEIDQKKTGVRRQVAP